MIRLLMPQLPEPEMQAIEWSHIDFGDLIFVSLAFGGLLVWCEDKSFDLFSCFLLNF